MTRSSFLYRLPTQWKLFIVFGLCMGCLTPLDIETEIGGTHLVISGQVSTLADHNKVYVGKTTFGRLPIPVQGAVVLLVDENDISQPYYEELNKPGEYFLYGFSGKPGTTYYVKVTLPNGEIYQSAPERIPLASGTVSSNYEIKKEIVLDSEGIKSEQQFISIFANSTLPETSEDVYLKWGVEEVFALVPTDFPDIMGNIPPPCYITQNADPQRVILFNGLDFATNTIENNRVALRMIDYTFLDRHYFTTYQSSITKEAHDYWRKVDILANQVGSIFDTPPAMVLGNMVNINRKSEEVLGYFQATNQSYDRFFTLPGDLPFPLLMTDCQYDDRSYERYPARCLDCLNERNSSYERPYWF